ncbi:MAG: tetratricopeptide repeat protein [Nitrospira sp.]|nr:tetratricopeptide repeat protein [Nitrospira sp.]
MSYRIKVPSRQLPVDETELVGALEQWLMDMKKYRWSLLAGLGGVIVAGGIVAAVLWYNAEHARKAHDLEREATLHFLMRPLNDPQKVEANMKEAIALYQKVTEEFPNTPSAPLAWFGLGNAFLETNQIDAAITAYQTLISTYSSNAMLIDLARQKLGYAYQLKNEPAQAEQAYLAVLNNPAALNRDHALYELARLDESQGRFDGALSRYRELTTSFPNSPLASEATIRQKILEARQSFDVPESASPAPASSPSPARSSSAGAKP